MKPYIIKNAHVISPDVDLVGASVVVENGKIKWFGTRAFSDRGYEVIDAQGNYLMPGFIDLHTHGSAGVDFCDKDPDAIFKMAEAKLSEGVTTFLPTTLTVSNENLLTSANNAKAYAEAGMPFSKVPGIHLEGPFINPACCGAQNPSYVRKPDMKEVKAISKVYPVKIISYAVEMANGAKFAKDCIKNGIVPSCGHSAAKMADFMPAYKNGLRRLTHFCNQMSPLHHREIGLVGAGLLLDDVNLEVICDKIHLSPEMVKLVFTRHNLEHVEMITDSLRCSHCKDGYSFEMGGLKVIYKKGEARLVKGGNLAGSTLWMGNALKNVHEITGIPLKELIRTTSLNQAIELGLGRSLGKIATGYTADMVMINQKNWKIVSVFVDGEQRI